MGYTVETKMIGKLAKNRTSDDEFEEFIVDFLKDRLKLNAPEMFGS